MTGRKPAEGKSEIEPTTYGLTPDSHALTRAVELAVLGSATKHDLPPEHVAARFRHEINTALDRFHVKHVTDTSTGTPQRKLELVITPSPEIPVTLDITPSPDIPVYWMSMPDDYDQTPTPLHTPTPPLLLIHPVTELTEADVILSEPEDLTPTPLHITHQTPTPADTDPTPTINWGATPPLTEGELQSYSRLVSTTSRQQIAYGSMPVRLDPNHELARGLYGLRESKKIRIVAKDDQAAEKPDISVTEAILSIDFNDL